MHSWHRFIGLPHVFGEDPRNGRGCDCLLMVFGVLDELDIPHPPFDHTWLDLAQAGQWADLEGLWDAQTEPVDQPIDGAVALLQNGSNGLGVAVAIDGGLLFVSHRRGVAWASLDHFKTLQFYRFKHEQAAAASL